MRCRVVYLALLAFTASGVFGSLPAAPLTDREVREAIRKGIRFLRREQNETTGGWSEILLEPYGVSSLAALALLNAGVATDDPAMQAALGYLRKFNQPRTVYSTALQTMVFCRATPTQDRLQIVKNVRWLESVQVTDGDRSGAWNYGRGGNGDPSNTQFALLALHESERLGIVVQPAIWQRSLEYWRRLQRADGAWGYSKFLPPSGSMTCAGIGSLLICHGSRSLADARVIDGRVECCADQEDHEAIERGLQWLGNKFSVHYNPGAQEQGGVNRAWLLYYLYAVERVGRLSGNRFIGRHDWFRAGAEKLVKVQNELSGQWKGLDKAESRGPIGTSLALLFLSKGRRPLLVSKLRYGEGINWDRHRSGIPNLTRRVETRWKRELTWQTMDIKVASLQDLMQSPVLFWSGRDAIELDREQKRNLRDYVNQGGFIFAESCTHGQDFDRSFRALMKELFPENPLAPLPVDHPIWFADVQVKQVRELYGVNACCRTSVVYCPDSLSAYWELSPGTREVDYPQEVQDEIEACLRIGENVVAYATNRQLRAKLDRPQLALSAEVSNNVARGTLQVPKLNHAGGADDAPRALGNLMRAARQQRKVRLVSETPLLLSPGDRQLFDYPIAFMHGRRTFQWNSRERQAMRRFLQQGGFLFADAICASPEFASAFRREMRSLFPEQALRRIPAAHPLLTPEFRGYDVRKVTLRDPQVRGVDDPLEARLRTTSPLLETLEIDGRVAVVFSPYDLSCALENQASLQCRGYAHDDAARVAINILLYGLWH
ncbi:MAG: DUF4159 domain-containing protein [Planctomycetota bacterium]|nr:DUF4159 domain-containing protein [Planctomycetota bacterium]